MVDVKQMPLGSRVKEFPKRIKAALSVHNCKGARTGGRRFDYLKETSS